MIIEFCGPQAYHVNLEDVKDHLSVFIENVVISPKGKAFEVERPPSATTPANRVVLCVEEFPTKKKKFEAARFMIDQGLTPYRVICIYVGSGHENVEDYKDYPYRFLLFPFNVNILDEIRKEIITNPMLIDCVMDAINQEQMVALAEDYFGENEAVLVNSMLKGQPLPIPSMMKGRQMLNELGEIFGSFL